MIFDPVLNESGVCLCLDIYFLLLTCPGCNGMCRYWFLMRLVAWLEAFMFMKLYGLHSLIKSTSASCGKHDKYAVYNQL